MDYQHRTLSKERWNSFNLYQQVLMIGNEMNRAKKLFNPQDRDGLKLCYERVLYLTDLTIFLHTSCSLRKELLRWRDLIAEQYIKDAPELEQHKKIYKSLLLFSCESAKQIPYLIK